MSDVTLQRVHELVMVCPKCALSKSRTKAVPGEGPEDARVMFIGEGPGWHEDRQGRPFVGPAGQFLEQMLNSINLPRPQVFITNIVKCRPPGNRDPRPEEIEACAPYLDKQIQLINPRVIVTLGRYSMGRFFPGRTISQIHGTARREDGLIYVAMYHPAAALHQQKLRQTLEDDFKKLPAFLAEAEKMQRKDATGNDGGGKDDDGRQLSLF